jgi:hypothetical protein
MCSYAQLQLAIFGKLTCQRPSPEGNAIPIATATEMRITVAITGVTALLLIMMQIKQPGFEYYKVVQSSKRSFVS